MSFDPIIFKQQFPLFHQPENKDLIYFDNAATTQKPKAVIEAISHFYTHDNGNAQRASHRLARQATSMIESVRKKSASFLGAESKDSIVFTRGATESLNIVAYGLRHWLTKNDEIIVSAAEHHANLLPWQEVSQATGCRLKIISPSLQELLNLPSKTTSPTVIAINIASNALGVKTELSVLKKIRENHPDAIIVLDITQWLAHEAIKLSALPCDFAACSAHKFYGPTGIGLLYGTIDKLSKLKPLLVGGEMVSTVNEQYSEYQHDFRKFEAGTSSMAAIAGLGACLDFWQQQDRQAMATHEAELTQYLHQKLFQLSQQHPECLLLTQADNNIGVASLSLGEPFNNNDCALWLDDNNIAARVGEHCAQLLWKKHYPSLKQGTIRLSLAAYNTKNDIDKTIHAIKQYLELIKGQKNHDLNNRFASIDWQALLNKQSWQQRYKQILLWGKSITTEENIRKETYFIRGCESQVWLKYHKKNERHFFILDSDSNVIKGLAAIFLSRINGKTKQEIETIDFEDYFNQLGLKQHLSPSRSNGFYTLYKGAMEKIKTS